MTAPHLPVDLDLGGAAASGRGAAATPTVGGGLDPLFESPATLDLFALGRRASRVREDHLGGSASFVRARRWSATAGWRGPRDATEAYVELADLLESSATAWQLAAAAGASLLVGEASAALHRAVVASGARVLHRFTYRAGEPAADRRARLGALRRAVSEGDVPWGVMPTPVGEAEGIDTLRVVAALRLDLPSVAHLVLDVPALGPRLAQMALGFGGDELWAPIVSERALRLGGNANNPAMTRKEAAVLIRGAGLVPRERIGPDRYTEETTP